MLQNMEVQLKPLMEPLSRVKDLPVPEFGSLQAWEARASAASRAGNGDSTSMDPSKSSQGLGYGGTTLPFLGETKVEVAFSGVDGKDADIKSEASGTGLKVLPPWMIKRGMNLTKEHRGEVKRESKMDGTSAAAEFSDDKKSSNLDDEKKNLRDEYVKAYYAALLKQQQELDEATRKQKELLQTPLSNGVSESSSSHQVGMKSKCEEDDDFECEEAPIGGNTSESYKVSDLNVEAEASGDDEDDIDWEEG